MVISLIDGNEQWFKSECGCLEDVYTYAYAWAVLVATTFVLLPPPFHMLTVVVFFLLCRGCQTVCSFEEPLILRTHNFAAVSFHPKFEPCRVLTYLSCRRDDEPMVVLDTHLDWRFAKNVNLFPIIVPGIS